MGAAAPRIGGAPLLPLLLLLLLAVTPPALAGRELQQACDTATFAPLKPVRASLLPALLRPAARMSRALLTTRTRASSASPTPRRASSSPR